jgi:protein-S-isoprenylcysteine O-methyltransferase Ste14
MTAQKKPFLKILIIYVIIGFSGYLSYTFIYFSREILRFFVADLVMTGFASLVGFGVTAPFWTAFGAVGMVLMFLFASIPMKENRLFVTRTDLKQYKAEVPMLIPKLKRK